MRRQLLAFVRGAAAAIGCPLLVAMILAGGSVGAACGQTSVATQVEQANAGRISVAETMAADISSDAAPFMQIVLNSKWGPGYGMLKAGNPGRRDPSWQRVKAAERPLRDLLFRLMNRTPSIRSAGLSYGDFSLFGERRFASLLEREQWIKTSGGDMDGGSFSRLKFGQELAMSSASARPDVFASTDSVWVCVPVMREGRFVCVLEVEFDKSP